MFSLGIQFAPISRVKEYKRRANNFEKGRQTEKKIKREREKFTLERGFAAKAFI